MIGLCGADLAGDIKSVASQAMTALAATSKLQKSVIDHPHILHPSSKESSQLLSSSSFILPALNHVLAVYVGPMVEANYQSAQRSIPMDASQLTDLAASFK